VFGATGFMLLALLMAIAELARRRGRQGPQRAPEAPLEHRDPRKEINTWTTTTS
jgi:hypothetical protein